MKGLQNKYIVFNSFDDFLTSYNELNQQSKTIDQLINEAIRSKNND